MEAAARKIFAEALNSVRPQHLTVSAVQRCGNQLVCNDRKYEMNNNVYVVGYGKAVLGMFDGLHSLINDHLKKCILSIPHGSSVHFPDNKNICVMTGAKNNLPDAESICNTLEILKLVNSLQEHDVLINLISGGGSALLCAPVEEVTLDGKLQTIRLLTSHGANIKQLNTVRQKLSLVKGGRLLHNCSTKNILSLIISDIIGNPLPLIASGPTVQPTNDSQSWSRVFGDLNIPLDALPNSVKTHIEHNTTSKEKFVENFCQNVVVGSNHVLVDEAVKTSEKLGYRTYVVTTTLECDAELAGRSIADFACAIQDNSSTACERLYPLVADLRPDSEWLLPNKRCFIFAGETTVNVTGTGKGGRNQHMVLAFLSQLSKQTKRNCLFLSAGTDGQDGPTDVAGAVTCGEMIEIVDAEKIDVYLANCDSYSFFENNTEGRCFIKTGFTGTNVMDIQLLIFDE